MSRKSTGNPLWDFLEVGPQPALMGQSTVSTRGDNAPINLPPQPYAFPPASGFNYNMDRRARFNEERHGGNVLDYENQLRFRNPEITARIIDKLESELRDPPVRRYSTHEPHRDIGDAVYRPDESVHQFRHPLNRHSKLAESDDVDALEKMENEISFLRFKSDTEGGLGVKDRIRLMLLQKALYGRKPAWGR